MRLNSHRVRVHLKTIHLVVMSMILVLVGGTLTWSGTEPLPNILILNSYHQGEDWSDNEIVGITATLKQQYPFLVPSIEHLDAKRFSRPEHLGFIQQYLKSKYQGRHFDLIFVLDNPAFDLMLKFRQELFPGVPVILAGINGFVPELIQEQDRITGIAEVQDIAGTLKLALTLHPKTKSVLVVNDYTSSGLAVRKDMAAVVEQFNDKIKIDYTPDGTVEDLVAQLQSLPADSLVLILTYVADKKGKTLTRTESTRLIANASPVPVYAMHETRLGHGIIGGMLLEGKEHGMQAAEIALRILADKEAASYGVEDSRSRPIFDYLQLARFKVDLKTLPENSTLINQPVSFFQQHRILLIPGVIVGVLLVIIIVILAFSVSRIRRAKNELGRSEGKYRGLFANIIDGLIIVDPESRLFVEANPAICTMIGYTAEEMVALRVEDIHPEASLPHVLAQFEMQMSGKITVASALPVQRKDGTVFHADVNAVPILIEGQHLFLGIFRDITERKLAEDMLRESEQRHRAYIQNAPYGVFVTDEYGRYQQVNPAACKLTGYTEPEILAMSIADLLSKESLEQGLLHFQQVVQKGRSHGELYCRTKSGEQRLWSMTATKISDTRIMGFCEDITERKQAEEENKLLQAQLLQAQKMEAIGTLAGGIAHDFNNILGAIIGYTEIAVDSITPDSIAVGYLEKVAEASHRAASLVKQILAFSRQANTEDVALQPAVIIKEAVKILRPSLPSTITIKQQIDTATKSILADPSKLHQILMNLCTNAYHAMEQRGGTLEITLKDCELSPEDLQNQVGVLPGSFVVLIIGDSGPGISAEIRDKIFEPYFTTKEVGKGTGMGLAIVHGIIKRYGGFITCESNLGKGTVFQVYFPALDLAVTAPVNTVENIPSGKERILFIDDEEILVDLGKIMLEHLGYEVTVRTSSLEAWNTFRNQPDQFDVVITDQTMPGLTGSDLALKMLQLRPNLPIILCTGYSSLISEDKAKSYGIKGFAMKPLVRKEIALLLRKVLDGKNAC